MAETHQISLPMEAAPQAPPPMETTPQAPPPMEGTLQTLLSVQHQRAAPVEATQPEKPGGKQRRGRRKIPMQRIHDDNNRLVTFSKRRAGIFRKAAEISTLCGVDVGILIFSPAGKPYAYGVPNIESIADRFLGRVNPDAQNDSLSRIVKEAQRKANLVKLNKDCDQLSVYLQNLKKEGDRLMEFKKKMFDGGCWWDTPVEDLTADQMQTMTVRMEEIKKNVSSRLRDLRAGASSSVAVVHPEEIQMDGNEGFRYVSDGGFGDHLEGGLSSAVAGVQGGVMQMGGNLGQGFGGAGGSGGFGDWRAGGSMAAGIQGGGFQLNGNGGLGGYGGGVGGLGGWGVSSSVQAGAMQMGGIGNGGNRYGGGVGGDFTPGASSSVSVQQGGMQTCEYGVGGLSGGDVADGGISQWRPVRSVAASSAVQPIVGSILVGGNGGGGYGGSVAGGGGLSDGWKPVNSSSTFTAIQGAKSRPMAGNFEGGGGCFGGLGDCGDVGSLWMQMGGDGAFGYKDGVGGSSATGGGDGNWRAVGSSTMQIGGIGGFCYNKDIDAGGSAGGAGGGLGGWGAGGASSSLSLPNPMQMGEGGRLDYGGLGGGVFGEFVGGGGGGGDFKAGGSVAAALLPDQDQMAGASNGASFYDGDGGLSTNNRFGDFLFNGGGKFI